MRWFSRADAVLPYTFFAGFFLPFFFSICCTCSMSSVSSGGEVRSDPTRISTPKDYRPADEDYVIITRERFETLLSAVDTSLSFVRPRWEESFCFSSSS